MATRTVIIILLFLSDIYLLGQGKVYFVIGSDTGIWQGLDVNLHKHHYNSDLYTNPSRNAFKVMDPNFRNLMKDSYGTPLKLTWWMMAGNTFRFADNTDVPHANSIVFYLMKKYHGEQVKLFNDELSLHYHTFTWTDFDNDGKYWWNQALKFDEYFDDFKFTLAQLLLDENVFPVSFRSGWHYMDNDWQNYLENVLPFSLHNDYPNKHIDTEEPLDNLYDWSLATSDFVPYHVSSDNYQLSGLLKGYNVRSVYTKRFSHAISNQLFENAANGNDQVICIWSHLPEDDFLDQLLRVDSLIQISAQNYASVNFEYCTGVEAYQKWLKTADSISPQLILTADEIGNEVYFNISTDENIFQTTPFVALKNVYEQYSILPCTEISNNIWRTTFPVEKSLIAKVGAAVTDESGNLSTKFIKYLPEDIFIDNIDFGYVENYGNWSTSSNAAWGDDCRIVTLNPGDSAEVSWEVNVPQTNNYNLFIQLPELDDPTSDISLKLIGNTDTLYNVIKYEPFKSNQWVYLTTALLDSNINYNLEIILKDSSANMTSFASDVIKISPLVKDKEISVVPAVIDFGNLVKSDTAAIELEIKNSGIKTLTVSSVSSSYAKVFVANFKTLTLSGMSSDIISLKYFSNELGVIRDTLFIFSDDPVRPKLAVPCSGTVVHSFIIVDNEDSTNYQESGTWAKSVAQAYGNSSRYSYLNQDPLASAIVTAEMKYAGIYDIYAIIPETVNSSDNALYTLNIAGVDIKSILINQNEIGGNWSVLFRSYLPNEIPISVKVEDTGMSTVGPVLRADAVKFQQISEITDASFKEVSIKPSNYMLGQNYPNPFNPSTVINYELKEDGFVTLKVYDVLGREVAVLVNENSKAGFHSYILNGQGLSSGVYFYRLQADKFYDIKKMVLLR